MEDLKEYFYSHFKTEEDFSKKYGMFAPIVKAYIESLISYKFITTTEPVDKLINTNIKLVKKFSVLNNLRDMNFANNEDNIIKNLTALAINHFSDENEKGIVDVAGTDIEVLLPKVFEGNKDYSNKTLNEFLKIFEQYSQTPEEANSKKDKFIKTIVHELNHAICHKEFFYVKNGELINDSSTFTKEELYTLPYTEFAGGIRIADYYKDGKVLIRSAGDRIHEGITEFLAWMLMSSKFIKQLRFAPDVSLSRSYQPYPSLIELYMVADPSFITSAYFKIPTPEQKNKFKELVNWQENVLTVFDDFNKLNDNSTDKQINEAETKLISVLEKQMDKILEIAKEKNLENKKLQMMSRSTYSFLDPYYWVEKAFDYANFKERDHELADAYANQFKQFRENKSQEFIGLVEDLPTNK